MFAKFFIPFHMWVRSYSQGLMLLAGSMRLIPMGSPRYMPIRPVDALFPTMAFTVAIYAHAFLGVVLLFFGRIDKFVLVTFVVPFLEFPLIALACRTVLHFLLRSELKHMKPEELEAYRAQLKK